MINRKKAMDRFIGELEELSQQGMTREEKSNQSETIKYYQELYQYDVRGLAVAVASLESLIRKEQKSKQTLLEFFAKAGNC